MLRGFLVPLTLPPSAMTSTPALLLTHGGALPQTVDTILVRFR